MMILPRLVTRARLAAAAALLSTFGLASAAHASPITFNGELTTDSTVVQFFGANYYYALHDFTVAADSTIAFSGQGVNFAPYALIYPFGTVDGWSGSGTDTSDPKIDGGGDLAFAGDGTNSFSSSVFLTAGTYQIMATSWFAINSGETNTGQYTITLSGDGLTAIPIASTVLLMGGGLLGLGLVIGQRRRSLVNVKQPDSAAST